MFGIGSFGEAGRGGLPDGVLKIRTVHSMFRMKYEKAFALGINGGCWSVSRRDSTDIRGKHEMLLCGL